jgi:predicted DNA-binding transcriptional regulator YafY
MGIIIIPVNLVYLSSEKKSMPATHDAMSVKNGPNWGARQRLEFIEFKAYWEGGVNRSDITRAFSVSIPQASADLADYQDLAPNNLVYDSSAKRYVATPKFSPRFAQPNSDEYLGQLSATRIRAVAKEHGWLSSAPSVDSMPLPTRPVDRQILRQLLAAIRGTKSLEIEYHSMNPDSTAEKWRRITPHAFAFDGFRWHVRAWCHRGNRFKDFLLSRCCGARRFSEPGASLDQDDLWLTLLDVKLVPNPSLTLSQRKAVELDYGMNDGAIVVSVRMALLYYFDKHVNPGLHRIMEQNEDSNEARRRPIVVRNVAAYTKALENLGITKTR